MKNWSDLIRNLTMLTQFGLSFITPLLLCLAGCWWLTSHAGAGGWVYIPGFFFGMGGSGMVAYKTYLAVMARDAKKKEKEKPKISFNSHV